MNRELLFVKGHLNGSCIKCSSPSTGDFNMDEDRDDEDGEYWATLTCVSCGHIEHFLIFPNINAFSIVDKEELPKKLRVVKP